MFYVHQTAKVIITNVFNELYENVQYIRNVVKTLYRYFSFGVTVRLQKLQSKKQMFTRSILNLLENPIKFVYFDKLLLTKGICMIIIIITIPFSR